MPDHLLAFVLVAFVIYLGVQAFRHRRSLGAALAAPVAPKLLRRILADGFLAEMLNGAGRQRPPRSLSARPPARSRPSGR